MDAADCNSVGDRSEKRQLQALGFSRPAEKALYSETWLEHCILRRSGVHYRLTEKSKGKLRLDILAELKDPG
jgi:hypothetical protein